MKVALFTLDPGGTSGLASGGFEFEPEAMMKARVEGSVGGWGKLETWEVEGDPLDQAAEIAEQWADFEAEATLAGFAVSEVRLVIERFQLRKATTDLSAIEVTWALFGCLVRHRPRHVVYQEPGIAKGFATKVRLERLGLWVKGSEHRRDAMRHLLSALSDA